MILIDSVRTADVFLDSNKNYTKDDGEQSVESDQTGNFSIEPASGTDGYLVSMGGIDNLSGEALPSDMYFVLDPITTAQSQIISPLTSLYHYYNNEYNQDFSTFKERLNINQNFMIRFDNYENLENLIEQNAATIGLQISMIVISLSDALSEYGVTKDMVYKSLAYMLNERTSSSETSLGDTTSIVTLLNNLIDREGVTAWSADQQIGMSAILSSALQEISFVPQGDFSARLLAGEFMHMYWGTDSSDFLPALRSIIADPTDQSLLNLYLERAYFAIMAGPPAGYVSIESYLNNTTYEVSANGSSNYIVDGVNADTTSLVIYARVGDTIVFEPTSNSVFTSHPFEISTTKNDTGGSDNIGSDQGWDQSTHTLVVSDNTPTTLYPHCGIHSGMYTNGTIQIVTEFDINNIDVDSDTQALQVKGTVKTGSYAGASGYTYDVYLKSTGTDEHQHTFVQYPGLTFYMGNNQGYHGASAPKSNVTEFKPKSHYGSDSGGIPYSNE